LSAWIFDLRFQISEFEISEPASKADKQVKHASKEKQISKQSGQASKAGWQAKQTGKQKQTGK